VDGAAVPAHGGRTASRGRDSGDRRLKATALRATPSAQSPSRILTL
jgi:hypothetical protein